MEENPDDDKEEEPTDEKSLSCPCIDQKTSYFLVVLIALLIGDE